MTVEAEFRTKIFVYEFREETSVLRNIYKSHKIQKKYKAELELY